MNPHTSKMVRSCDKTATYTSRTSASVVGTVIPMESNGRGSIRRLFMAALPFLRLTGDTFPLVEALVAFSSRFFRTLDESSTFLQNTRRSGGTSAGDGYSANNNEDENLRRSRMPIVSIMFGTANVGNSATTHFESFSYALSSITRGRNYQRWKLLGTYEHTRRRTGDDVF